MKYKYFSRKIGISMQKYIFSYLFIHFNLEVTLIYSTFGYLKNKSMAKKKKPKDEWEVFVSNLLKRKRANRKYVLPTAYLESVADQLWRTNPSKEIIYNTLVDVATVMFTKGFDRKQQDVINFRQKQERHMETEFKKFCDQLDDMIHSKNQPSK
jgi:hypothetical protein